MKTKEKKRKESGFKTVGRVVNTVDPDQVPHSASYLGLQCLLKPVWPNT